MAINLLPWREALYIKKRQVFLCLLLLSLIVFAVIWSKVEIYLSDQKKRIHFERQFVISKLQALQQQNKENAGRVLGNEKTGMQLKRIQRILEKQRRLFIFLNQLSEIQFKAGFLTGISFENDQLYLKGTAESMEMIFSWVGQLKKLSVVKVAQLLSAEQITADSLSETNDRVEKNFNLTIRLQ